MKYFQPVLCQAYLTSYPLSIRTKDHKHATLLTEKGPKRAHLRYDTKFTKLRLICLNFSLQHASPKTMKRLLNSKEGSFNITLPSYRKYESSQVRQKAHQSRFPNAAFSKGGIPQRKKEIQNFLQPSFHCYHAYRRITFIFCTFCQLHRFLYSGTSLARLQVRKCLEQ